MRPVLILLAFCFFVTASAQNDSCIFLKKGAELEYRSFLQTPLGGKLEVTRFTLTVTDVKDSNNVSYCYITKKARSKSLEGVSYERHFVVKRSGNKMIIPYDLYALDTVYRGDVLARQNKKEEKMPFTTSKVVGNVAFHSAYNAGSLSLRYSVPAWDMEMSLLNYGVPNAQSVPGFKDMKKLVMKVTTDNITIEEEKGLEIEAGTFDCFRISVSIGMKSRELNLERKLRSVFFFSPEYGLLKTGGNEDEVYTVLARAEYEPYREPDN
jgi:hypothetical protein